MRSKALVSIVAAVWLAHGLALSTAQAQRLAQAPGSDPARAKEATDGAEAKRPPVPVAKPASPAPEQAKPPEKHADGDAKGETVPPGSKPARASGPLPVGSGERAFNAPDCRWTGERVISTLMREEVDAASQLTRFYSMFGCPTPHIGLALSCMVERMAEQGPHDKKIESCWADPTVSRTAAAPPASEQPKDPGKPGGEDKPPQKN